jgi:UrcA family protein
MKSALLPLALAASLGAAPAASASSLVDIRRIGYAPADLREDAGVRSLERRAAAAAHRVCGGLVRRPLHEHTAIRACLRAAHDDARDQIARAVGEARGLTVAER